MKITDVQIDGFGVWSGLSVDELSDKLTVFFGRNEAGKTTLMQFMRTVLYGFSEERRERYFPPVHGGPAGGSLRLSGPGGQVEVRRHVDDQDETDSLGEVVVTSADGTTLGQNQLDRLLSGVDEAIFNNVFAVGLREFQQLGTLEDTEAADQLYKLTSGLDRVSLLDVMDALKDSRNQVLADDDRPSQIVQLLVHHEKLRRQIEEASQGTKRWTRARAHSEQIKREITQLQVDVDGLQNQARTVEIALQVYDRWQSRDQLDQQIEALGPLAEISFRLVERLDRINTKIEQRRELLAKIKQQRKEFRREAMSLPINRKLWAQAARIEALGEHGPWITSLENQTQQLGAEIANVETELAQQCERVGLSSQADAESLSNLSRRSLSALRAPARALREENQRLRQVKEDLHAHREQAEQLSRQLEESLAQHGRTDLMASLEEAGNKVSRLRRRLQLEQRLDEMGRLREELEQRSHDLFQHQVLPMWVLASLGGLFVLGVVLILTGLIGGAFLSMSGVAGWSLALLGIGGTGAAIGTKLVLERSLAKQLESCQKQLQLLKSQKKEAQRELEELDAQIPAGGGSLDSRLATEQGELKSLEELLPLDAQRQTAHQQSEADELRIVQATHAVKDARNRWRSALAMAGLPETLSPKHVRNLVDHCESISQLRRRLDSRREEFEQRSRELQSLADRIEQIFLEVAIECPESDLPSRLQSLTAALAKQQQFFDRRRSLRGQDRRQRRRQNRLEENIDDLARRRRSLMSQAGVEDEEQLRDVARLRAEAEELIRQRDDLTSQIDVAIGEKIDAKVVSREISNGDRTALEQRWEQHTTQIENSQQRLGQLHERGGQLRQEMKSLVEDRRLAEAKLEIGCVEQQLKEAISRWQALAVTSLLLESIRQIYETERQPETLREASGYLTRLTSKQYTRVWTPLGENSLRVDDANGESLSLDVLSRGTREAVFLSLRLALAAGYARRGAMIPLILDDVLVNLDAERTKAAAGVLREFSKRGHQLLLFTCHEHIMKVFKTARVEVRQLPSRAVVTQETEEATEEVKVKKKPARRRKKKEETPEEVVQEIEEEIIDEEDQWEEEEELEADDEVEAEAGEEEDEYEDEEEAEADEEEYEEEDELDEDEISMEVEEFDEDEDEEDDEDDEVEPDGSFQWEESKSWEDDESEEAA